MIPVIRACKGLFAYDDKHVANQLSIARHLGITQAAVSMALSNHPRISEEMRKRVREAADKLGYRPNPYVTTLMSRIREGRVPEDHGTIAILVDEESVKAWLDWHRETYSANYVGYQKEAKLHGYRTECFCLRSSEDSPAAIDRRLRARGITGMILAAPSHPQLYPKVDFPWGNYACAAVGYTWLEPAVDRVTPHHLHNMVTSFEELIRRGCRRIGFCQPTLSLLHKVPSHWMAGFLMSQWEFSDLPKLEPFVGTIHDTSATAFRTWIRRWKPDGLITVIGDEAPRLRAMRTPLYLESGKGVHLVCLNRPLQSPFPGVDENNELVGRKTCEAVVNRLIHNQQGLPEKPNEILVPGAWIEKDTR
ncbi:MAG: LacI family DNA-binding transcriptional regulator [Opitutaceae bacterium]|jgi:DNA-binding LacI/PurR family transcriptional regulator